MTEPIQQPDNLRPAPLDRWRWLLFLLILTGAALRLWRALLANLPMRIDEIRLAVNIQDRSYAQLAYPLDHQQGAPVGFLWLAKAAVQLVGDNDTAYRIVPMIAGIAVVALMPLLARRVTGRAGVLFATALAALAPWAIQYSSDFKQYTFDALATAAILLAAIHALHPDATWRSRAALAAIGAIAITCSHSAMFVTAGVGLTLGVSALRHKRRPAVLQLLGVALFWTVTFALLWQLNLRHISGRGDLMDYWAQDFMPLPPRNAEDWGWYARAPLEWLNTTGYYFNPALLLLALAGLVALRRRPALAGILLMPTLITLAASAAHRYPFANRLIAFLLPATILLVAIGLDAAMNTLLRALRGCIARLSPTGRRPRERSAAAELLAVALAVFFFLGTLPFSQINRPWMGGRFDLVRPMRDVRNDRREDDLIILGNALWWPYARWYAPQMGLPNEHDEQHFLVQRMPRDPDDGYAQQLRLAVAGKPRVWVLAADGIWMGHHPQWPTLGNMHDTTAPTREVLEQLGTIQQQHDYANVTAYLLIPNTANDADNQP